MFEKEDSPNLIRRVTEGSTELVRASLRPLRRRTIRRRLLRDYVMIYIAVVLWLHFIGYRSWYPEFHRVRETFHDAAIRSFPKALLGTLISYLLLLREHDWI